MKKTRKRVLIMLSVLILVLVALIGGLRILESTVLLPQQEELPAASKTITRNGVSYFPRQDITTLLLMGIDEVGPVKSSGSYRNTGESDVIMIFIFDEQDQTYRVLTLNRDTMLEMPVLGLGGKVAGTYYGQLALSHTYGTGLRDSSENTRNTISKFLYGVEIDYYVSLHMDAIAILNDAVGGVTVEVKEDFSDVDPTISMGTVTLTGEQALNYIRTRKDVGDQLNSSRIERHKQYMDGFSEAFRAKQATGIEFILDVYERIQPYMVTDCSANAITGMMERFGNYRVNEVVTPEGENVLSEKYFEFYVDEEKLDALILRLFYRPKG